MIVFALGLGAMFVAVTTAANAGVPADKAGLAAALLNSSQQVGGALGLAIFSAIATSRINHLLASNTPPADALTSGFQRALLASSIFLTKPLGRRAPTGQPTRWNRYTELRVLSCS
jgi:MFS family permease